MSPRNDIDEGHASQEIDSGSELEEQTYSILYIITTDPVKATVMKSGLVCMRHTGMILAWHSCCLVFVWKEQLSPLFTF